LSLWGHPAGVWQLQMQSCATLCSVHSLGRDSSSDCSSPGGRECGVLAYQL
jgi:hypothetical protein